MRLCLIFVLCLFGFQSNAHEMTPTYPVLDSSYIEGVVVAKMKLFNRRQDVEYYEINVFTEDWKSVSFATTNRLLKVDYNKNKMSEMISSNVGDVCYRE